MNFDRLKNIFVIIACTAVILVCLIWVCLRIRTLFMVKKDNIAGQNEDIQYAENSPRVYRKGTSILRNDGFSTLGRESSRDCRSQSSFSNFQSSDRSMNTPVSFT